MPKEGFKSVTLPKSVYNNFFSVYDKQKDLLKMDGVFSFAGFITFKINQILKKEEN